MTKLLVILVLVVLAVGFVYWLIHPYIAMARKALGFIQGVRTGTFNTNSGFGDRREKVAAPQKLVQCASCGTWVPTGRAITGRGLSYCTENCREAKARTG